MWRSALIVQSRLYLHLFRDAWRLMRAIDLLEMSTSAHLLLSQEVVTGTTSLNIIACAIVVRSLYQTATRRLPSVLPAPCGFHRYEPRVYPCITAEGSQN